MVTDFEYDVVEKAQEQALREEGLYADAADKPLIAYSTSETERDVMTDAVYAGLGVSKEQISGFMTALDRAVTESSARDADFAKLALFIKWKDDLEEALIETMFRLAGKWRDLQIELEDELRNPVVDAVYKKQAARHGGYVVSRECLIDMVKHLVHRVKELEDQATTLQEEVGRLRCLQFDPGGGDKIDKLEQSQQFTKHALAVAEERIRELSGELNNEVSKP